MSTYENLSGTSVSYQDGNLYKNQQQVRANTASTLLIGSAIDGPVGEPISVNAIGGPRAAEKLFGSTVIKQRIDTGKLDPVTGDKVYRFVNMPHQGSLIRKMYEQINQGNDDVRIVRVAGRRAKTELFAKDSSRVRDEVLGKMPGNQAFDLELPISTGVVLPNGITKVTIKDSKNAVVRTVSGSQVANYVGGLRLEQGKYFVTVKQNVLSFGQLIEVEYNETKRAFTEVQLSLPDLSGKDPDRLLTRDSSAPRYFSSTKRNWSGDLNLGHTITVFVDGRMVPMIDTKGDFVYRPGKEDGTVSNPLQQTPTDLEYSQGGVRFTTAYDTLVASEGFPALGAATVVEAEFFYFTETTTSGLVDKAAVGSAPLFALKAVPETQAFSIYYEVGGAKKYLDTADISVQYPAGPSDIARVTLAGDAAPIGVTLIAVYETTGGLDEDPKIEVLSRYAGTVYAGLHDLLDESTHYGVAIKVELDPADSSERIITIEKPEEKRLTAKDLRIVYKTASLRGVQTLRQFANFVNNDKNNNVVELVVDNGSGEVAVRNLFETDRAIKLGEKFDETLKAYVLHKDLEAAAGTEGRFPWIGSNGFFDKEDLKQATELYDELGGVYEYDVDTDDYVLAKQGLYSRLQQYPVDQIVLLDAYIDTKIGKYEAEGSELRLVVSEEKKFDAQLAQHCAIMTAKEKETLGYINFSPLKGLTLREVQEHVASAVDERNAAIYMYDEATHELVISEEGNELIDIGAYVQRVFGPEVAVNVPRLGTTVSTGEATYAGLVSRLAVQSAPTNKKIEVNGLRYTLTDEQQNVLAGAGYVTFHAKVDPVGQSYTVVREGVTSALPNSDYKRLSALRVTHATVQEVRLTADPFIGEPNGLAQRNSLSTQIRSKLDRLKEAGVINDFEYTIYVSDTDRTLGNSFIDLELVPAFETRRIKIRVALRSSL